MGHLITANVPDLGFERLGRLGLGGGLEEIEYTDLVDRSIERS